MKVNQITEATVDDYEKTLSVDGVRYTDNSINTMLTALAKHLVANCSDVVPLLLASNGEHGIWRGSRTTSTQYFLADPSTGTRKSQNAPNYYTVIMDNSPHFQKFPKRSKSLICSTDRDRALQYARSNYSLYLMVPYNGVNVGVCRYDDIWESYLDLSFLSSNKRSMHSAWYDLSVVDFSDLASGLREFGFPLDYKAMFDYSRTDFFREKFTEAFPTAQIRADHFIPSIIDAMHPARTGFSLTTPQNIFSGKHKLKEVWFSGKCVAISAPVLDNVINEIGEIL